MQITLQLLFLQMDFTTAEGFSAPASLWYPQGIAFDNSLGNGAAGVDWHGYKDIAHFQSGGSPIGQIHDATGGAEYFGAIMQPVTPNTSHAADTASVLATLALSHKTAPVLNGDGSAALDANQQPQMKSPFDGAQIVVLPVTVTL